MGRRRIEIKRIDKDRPRQVTYIKRRIGLLKKAHELATLCDAEVVVLIKDEQGKNMYFSSSNKDFRVIMNEFRTIDEIKTAEDFLNTVTEENSNNDSTSNNMIKSVISGQSKQQNQTSQEAKDYPKTKNTGKQAANKSKDLSKIQKQEEDVDNSSTLQKILADTSNDLAQHLNQLKTISKKQNLTIDTQIHNDSVTYFENLFSPDYANVVGKTPSFMDTVYFSQNKPQFNRE